MFGCAVSEFTCVYVYVCLCERSIHLLMHACSCKHPFLLENGVQGECGERTCFLSVGETDRETKTWREISEGHYETIPSTEEGRASWTESQPGDSWQRTEVRLKGEQQSPVRLYCCSSMLFSIPSWVDTSRVSLRLSRKERNS